MRRERASTAVFPDVPHVPNISTAAISLRCQSAHGGAMDAVYNYALWGLVSFMLLGLALAIMVW